jgi:hypothetical protein
MEVSTAALDVVRRQLGDPTTWREGADRRLEIGPAYAGGEAVAIVVRKRGHWYHLDDDGAAVAKARALGARPDWLGTGSAIVAEEGFNVNRRGVVFVGAVEGRDLAKLALRLGECAYAVHVALLESASPA